MSFHPNDVARRARMSSTALSLGFVLLVGAALTYAGLAGSQEIAENILPKFWYDAFA